MLSRSLLAVCGCAQALAFAPLSMVMRPSARPTVTGAGGSDSGGGDTGRKSLALPFLDAPAALDGSMLGDAGFDPLGFANADNLDRLRECEIKHGRLAMIALGGWPIMELALGVATRTVPPASVCTGSGCSADTPLSALALPLEAIGRFGGVYWAAALVLAAAGELALPRRRAEGHGAGDLGVDPFALANDRTRLAELKHGRLAMAAFAAHYAGVFARSKGVVFAHQVWGEVCVVNLRADLGFPAPICYPRPEAALDTVLSWEIMYRVLTGYFKEPYF